MSTKASNQSYRSPFSTHISTNRGGLKGKDMELLTPSFDNLIDLFSNLDNYHHLRQFYKKLEVHQGLSLFQMNILATPRKVYCE